MIIRYNEIKNLKEGDIVYECSYGKNIEIIITSNPIETFNEKLEKNQISWTGIYGNQHIDFLVTEGMEHYGPQLYHSPAYA